MRFLQTLATLWLAMVMTEGWISASPDNDDFVNATPLAAETTLEFEGDTTEATREAGEPLEEWDDVRHSVWWQWTAPVTARVLLVTTNTSVDTVLVVGEGEDLWSFQLLAYNDDLNFGADLLNSRVSFRAQAGRTYRFALLSYDSGPVILRLETAPPGPVNDDFVDAITLPGPLPLTASGNNLNASNELLEPNHADDAPAASVWWRWVSPLTTNVVVKTAGSSFDTRLGVYTGMAVDQLTTVAANDDAAAGARTSRLNFLATAGRTYFIAVDGYEGETGNIKLSLSAEPLAKAPAWNLPDVDGRVIRWSDFAGKVVILDFWATWCGPCVQELPGFIELQNRYGPDGFTMVGISLDRDENYVTTVANFIVSHGMNYPVPLGNFTDIDSRFGGVGSIPTTFVINHRGEIVFKHVGFHSKATFESEVVALLAAAAAATEPPPLLVEMAGGALRVSWTDSGTSFVVQVADSPAGAWSPWSGAITTGNARRSIDLPFGANARFVRLARAP